MSSRERFEAWVLGYRKPRYPGPRHVAWLGSRGTPWIISDEPHGERSIAVHMEWDAWQSAERAAVEAERERHKAVVDAARAYVENHHAITREAGMEDGDPAAYIKKGPAFWMALEDALAALDGGAK